MIAVRTSSARRTKTSSWNHLRFRSLNPILFGDPYTTFVSGCTVTSIVGVVLIFVAGYGLGSSALALWLVLTGAYMVLIAGTLAEWAAFLCTPFAVFTGLWRHVAVFVMLAALNIGLRYGAALLLDHSIHVILTR